MISDQDANEAEHAVTSDRRAYVPQSASCFSTAHGPQFYRFRQAQVLANRGPMTAELWDHPPIIDSRTTAQHRPPTYTGNGQSPGAAAMRWNSLSSVALEPDIQVTGSRRSLSEPAQSVNQEAGLLVRQMTYAETYRISKLPSVLA